jgi:Leucine-rich repeat (LRR) protein
MCKGVKKLFLKNNKLKELQPGKFYYLSNLQDLELNYNQIIKLKVDIFHKFKLFKFI